MNQDTRMNIDQNAPLSARQVTTIAAAPDRVWSLLTGIDRWPEWQPGVSAATLEGALDKGATFRWKANGLTIRSTIRDLEPGRRIGWTGDSLGMSAVHIWTLEPEDSGTRVATEESLSGWVARLLKLFDRNYLQKSLATSLRVLKAAAQAGS